MRVLILGATGMLGFTLFRRLSQSPGLDVFGTCRNPGPVLDGIPKRLHPRLVTPIDANDFALIKSTLNRLKPDCVINCIGIIKQLPIAKEPIPTIQINALFPHLLAKVCNENSIRLIHFSTDCVFSGHKGNYLETDPSDVTDLYGRTKSLGEVDYGQCLTLRTSIIGHELREGRSLIEWFLSQQGETQGYTHAIYSGFPTVEIARILVAHVLPNPKITGLYQVSAETISKFELLKLVAKSYGKAIEIHPSDWVKENKALNSTRFRSQTGYQPPTWPELVNLMHEDYLAWQAELKQRNP